MKPGPHKRKMLRLCGRKCFYCETPLSLRQATIDHFVPKFHGGDGSIRNKVAACERCNTEKGSRMPTDAERAKLARLWEERGDLISPPAVRRQLAWERMMGIEPSALETSQIANFPLDPDSQFA